MKKFNNKFLRNILFILSCCLFFSCQNKTKAHFKSPIDSLSFLLKQDDSNISLLTKRAQEYIKVDKFSLSKNDIDHAYDILKNDSELLLTRGELYFILNKTRISKESWERCLKLDPNNLKCREKLTNLFCVVKDSKCKLMIDTLALINDGLIPNSLIVYLKESDEYELAIDLLNNRIKKFPKDKDALTLLSILHSDTSSNNNYFNSELAENFFKKIMNLYPHDPQVYYNFGKHKQNLSEYTEAIDLYEQGLQLTSNSDQSYYNMGFCSMQLQEYSQAIEYFTNAINIDKSFLLAYHARAYVYDLMDKPEKSITDWKNCLMLNPSYIPALEALSK